MVLHPSPFLLLSLFLSCVQIFYYNRKHGFIPLYIIARDDEECKEWVDELRGACHLNKDMLLYYHPGAYRGSGWTCCRQKDRSTMGCHPTHALLTRGQSNYSDLRRRISASDSGILEHVGGSPRKGGIPKSKSIAAVNQSSMHKQKQRGAEGGTTRSTSFVDMTSFVYDGHKKGSSTATKVATKHSGTGGEISDSCITLPVERMEGVKETEEERGTPRARGIVDLKTKIVVHSPRSTHSHRAQQTKLSDGSCASGGSSSSPVHLHLNTSWSQLSMQRISSASSAGSQPSSLKNPSYPTQLTCPAHLASPPFVPAVDVNNLSARRREMELMTHVSALSQPDSPPSPDFVSASDMYYSTGEERSSSVPLLDFSKKLKPAVSQRPHAQHRSGGKRGRGVGPNTVKAGPPMINPRVSDVQPFIIHL